MDREDMDKRSYRTGMDVAYRISALSFISAIRMVFTDAAVVTADMMSLVDVKRKKRDIRRGVDLSNPVQLVNDATDKWQQNWATCKP